MISNYSKKHATGELGPPLNGVGLSDGIWADYNSDDSYLSYILVDNENMVWLPKDSYPCTGACKAYIYNGSGSDKRFSTFRKGSVITFTQDYIG